MSSLKSSIYRLILGDLADAPERVRQRMLSSIPTTTLSLTVYSTTLLVICGTTLYISRAPWAWAWMLASIVLVGWRTIHPLLEARRGRPAPLASIMISSGLAMASFGFGCAMSISTGNLALTTMAMSGSMGVLAGLATRWAALPRPAIATMLLSVVPPMVAMAALGGTHVLAAVAMGFVILSIATFTKHNQEYLLAAFTAEEASRQIARLDALTGLANRAELTRQLEQSCRMLPPESDPRRGLFALLYLDLDGFKSVNDNHGHGAGDELLRQVAQCLRETASSAEIIARIGGDEFVILLRDADALAARAVADEIIAAVSRPRSISDGVTVQVGCSVGVCVAPDQARNPELLMARADAALYRSKSLGKGQSGLWRTLA